MHSHVGRSVSGSAGLLTETQCQEVVASTHDWIRRGESLFADHFAPVQVLFDLRGRAAGMYRVRGRQRVIRYNPAIFQRYYRENLAETIPHEVAHYLCDMLYGLRRIRPHGREWRAIMQAFGVTPQRTASFDLSGMPLRQHRQFAYRCACREHQLGSRRHFRVLRGEMQYLCKYCHKPLTAIAGQIS